MIKTNDKNLQRFEQKKNKKSEVYKRYVDDKLSVMTHVETASEYLTTLNNSQLYRLYNGALRKPNASLSGKGGNEEWMLSKHKGVQNTDGQWPTVTLPQPRGWET